MRRLWNMRHRKDKGRTPLRYAIDEVNSDRIAGWAFAPDDEVSIEVVVSGRIVGTATTQGYRSDVAQSLQTPEALRAGFEFPFGPEHFNHVDGHEARIELRLRANGAIVTTESHTVPVLVSRTPAVTPLAPLPADVVTLLRRFRPRIYEGPWDEGVCDQVAADLRFLLQRGPRAVPGLHAHLVLLGQLWMRAASVEKYFPRENAAADAGAKDRSAVQNSAVEVFAIAAHFATIVANGVPGPLLEFGCFKGFSTAILSDACHQLRRDLHVFDSFAGLPASNSAYYRAGEFVGSRPEVEANISNYGRSMPVQYHEGFFAETVPRVSLPQIGQLWLDVDLESSARDVMVVLPRVDRRGAVFSHECPKEAFRAQGIASERSPEAVIPPILDAFAASGRQVAGRHIDGYTGAFWDADTGIPVLPTPALLALRDLALEL